ncbi:MAG: hypothetical protein H7317_01230 [Pseudorhodobacter sp.]|nr:hypothetical protein [Pseudorhodobacter sp.]
MRKNRDGMPRQREIDTGGINGPGLPAVMETKHAVVRAPPFSAVCPHETTFAHIIFRCFAGNQAKDRFAVDRIAEWEIVVVPITEWFRP